MHVTLRSSLLVCCKQMCTSMTMCRTKTCLQAHNSIHQVMSWLHFNAFACASSLGSGLKPVSAPRRCSYVSVRIGALLFLASCAAVSSLMLPKARTGCGPTLSTVLVPGAEFRQGEAIQASQRKPVAVDPSELALLSGHHADCTGALRLGAADCGGHACMQPSRALAGD